jgi:hypothetical protein
VYCYCQAAGDLDCQAGSRLAFRMISFNSLVALVISCSSAANRVEISGQLSRRAMQIIDADRILERARWCRKVLLPRSVPDRPCERPSRLCCAPQPKSTASCDPGGT